MPPSKWSRPVALMLAITTAVVAGVVIAASIHGSAAPTAPEQPGAAAKTDDVVEATCGGDAFEPGGMSGARPADEAQDVVLGPLVLAGAKALGDQRPTGFGGHGFKIPVTLPNGAVATLSVPRSMRGRVGLVFSHATEDRVVQAGVRSADASVRFTGCTDEPAGRTGWTGGLVVDRPRCATLVATLANGQAVRRQVPLGRPCSPSAG